MGNAYSKFKTQKPWLVKLDRALHYFLNTVLFVFGLLTIIFCLNRIHLARQSLHWQSVPGKIIWSYISVSGKNSGVIYLQTNYRYTVDGVEYAGTEVGYGYRGFPFGEGREAAEAKAARYPSGATVTVFYDPKSPGYSCLEPGGDLGGYVFPIGGGFLFMIFGIWGLWRLVLPKKKR